MAVMLGITGSQPPISSVFYYYHYFSFLHLISIPLLSFHTLNKPNNNMSQNANITDLIGKTLVEINNLDHTLVFHCATGEIYTMFHNQDCCESVYIEDINGDLNELLNTPILDAYETSNDTPMENTNPELCQWTFYTIRTVKQTVVIRWYGTSNGYYSVSVNFEHTNA